MDNSVPGTTTGDGTIGGGLIGVLAGCLGAVLAVGGGVFWHQLRKRRRPKTIPLAPITVRFAPLAPRVQLALPPSADPSAGQGEGGPQEQAPWEQAPWEQAPWEQPTLVDLQWAPGPPSAGNPFPGQGEYPYGDDPQRQLSQLRIQTLPPVENPFLEEDQDQVQHPPWGPGSPPPAMPAQGRHAAQHPDPAQHPYPDGPPDTAKANGPAPGKRRKPR